MIALTPVSFLKRIIKRSHSTRTAFGGREISGPAGQALPAGLLAVPSFLPLKINLFLVGVLLAAVHHSQDAPGG
jgi:hypothetical protein